MHTPNSAFFSILACTATLSAAMATGQTAINATSTGNTGAAPNGIAVNTTELLFTQPFCSTTPNTTQFRGIYKENLAAGTSTLVGGVPDTGLCAENYLTISAGQGGFTAGDTFVTGDSTTMPGASAVFKNGSTPFIDALANSNGHAGIIFDTIGTFGSRLIVTLPGAVQGYDSTATQKFSYPGPAGYSLEGAAVAPLTFSPCPGCLFVTAALNSNINNPAPSGKGAIYIVHPTDPNGTPLQFWSNTPGPEPEGLIFVANNVSCSLSGYSYFVSGYATGAQKENGNATNGAILAWTPAQLTPVIGQILVPDEQGTVSAFSGPGTSTTFAVTGYQLEASTTLSCPTGGCPATFGFWKHHPFPPSMFAGGVATIGCMTYSPSTLVDILNTAPQGGNAVLVLAHQLIAAIANFQAGSTQTAAATAAITSAQQLLCSNGINMSTSFVASSSTLGQQMTALANTLDAFNSSAPSCEGTGLTTSNP